MSLSTTTPAEGTRFLTRPEGKIGYDIAGTGPLIVLVPGMGDLRGTYRFLAPSLRSNGYRVACTELRTRRQRYDLLHLRRCRDRR
jgi:dienelactone hydrolase